jgi:hypothetical protein
MVLFRFQLFNKLRFRSASQKVTVPVPQHCPPHSLTRLQDLNDLRRLWSPDVRRRSVDSTDPRKRRSPDNGDSRRLRSPYNNDTRRRRSPDNNDLLGWRSHDSSVQRRGRSPENNDPRSWRSSDISDPGSWWSPDHKDSGSWRSPESNDSMRWRSPDNSDAWSFRAPDKNFSESWRSPSANNPRCWRSPENYEQRRRMSPNNSYLGRWRSPKNSDPGSWRSPDNNDPWWSPANDPRRGRSPNRERYSPEPRDWMGSRPSSASSSNPGVPAPEERRRSDTSQPFQHRQEAESLFCLPVGALTSIFLLSYHQSCGSVTFWYGSGCGSVRPKNKWILRVPRVRIRIWIRNTSKSHKEVTKQ